ncbi:hypothetical protein C8R44DRAFT_864751 [Mycena epipterygia]|nr:hypothetical protein C8R44DRAFT_864751 [Mycena epipterygia]
MQAGAIVSLPYELATKLPFIVKGWKSSSGWGFPKGKINEDEPAHSCAIREVLEETEYNLASQINKNDVIKMSIYQGAENLSDTSKIEWFKLTDLPTWKRNKAAPGKFYLISPFIGHVVHDGFAQSAIDSESLDPHFACLLSSLSLSAAAAVGGKGVGEPALTIKTSEPVSEPSIPVPVTASLSGSQSFPLHANSDWSSSIPAPLPDTSEEEDAPPVPTETKSPPPQSLQHTLQTQSLQPRDVLPVLLPTHSRSRANGASSVAEQGLTTNFEYGRHLSISGLALLESVADESTRMLSHRAPTPPPPPPVMGHPRPLMNNHHPHYPYTSSLCFPCRPSFPMIRCRCYIPLANLRLHTGSLPDRIHSMIQSLYSLAGRYTRLPTPLRALLGRLPTGCNSLCWGCLPSEDFDKKSTKT